MKTKTVKRLLLFVTVLFICVGWILPWLFPQFVAKAQTGDPIDAGITDLKAKVNATYARGDCWSVKYEDGVYKWRSEPMWVWNGSQWVPYIFTRDDAKKCYRIQTGLVGAEIYDSGDVKIYDPNVTEVRVKSEEWELWAEGKEATLNKPITWNVITNSSGVFIERQQTTSKPSGILKITYVLRVGLPLKHIVEWTANADTSNIQVKQVHFLDFNKVKTEAGVITSSTKLKSASFLFQYDGNDYWVMESHWSMVYYPNGTLREKECLLAGDIDFAGKQVIYTFGNWTLTGGESLVVDPDTMTISPPTKDSYVMNGGSNPDKNFGSASTLLVRTYGSENYDYDCRAFFEFDISSIPPGTINKAEVRVYQSSFYGVTGRKLQYHRITGSWSESGITWNNQPGVSGDNVVTVYASSSSDIWFNVAVTNQVSDAHSSGSTYGVRVKFQYEGRSESTELHWDSKEGEHIPELYVEYTPNQSPNAPMLNSPSANARFNPSASVTFSWTFSDPNSGDSQSAYRFQLDDNSDFSSPIIDTGKVSSSTSNTTQTLPSTVGLYYWRVKTWDSYDAEGPYSSGRAIIVDKLEVYQGGVVDDRVNYNAEGTVWFKVRWQSDDAEFQGSHGSVTLNGSLLMTWSSTNNRWEYSYTLNAVGKKAYYVISITDNQYGITGFDDNVGTKSIVWDRVDIDSFSVADNRINVGDTAQFTVAGVYEYDGEVWVGTYSLNDTTTKNTVGKYGYRVSSITDSNYGLTAFTQTAPDLYVIFDRIEIYYMVLDDSRVDVESSVEFRVKARLDYDNHELGSGDSVTANFGALSWDATNGWFVGSYSQNTVSDYTFTVTSASEATYGITATYIATSEPTGIWDEVEVSIEAQRLQNSSNLPYYFMPDETYALLVKAWYAYDGSPCVGNASLIYGEEVLDEEVLNGTGYAWIQGPVPNVESFSFTVRIAENLYVLENATTETAVRYVNYLTVTGFGAYGPPSELDIGWTMGVAYGILNEYEGALFIVDEGVSPLTVSIGYRVEDVKVDWLWINDTSLWYGDPFQAKVRVVNYKTETIHNVNVTVFLGGVKVDGYLDKWTFFVDSIAPSDYAEIVIEGVFGGNVAPNEKPPQRSYPVVMSYVLNCDEFVVPFSNSYGAISLVLTTANVTVRDALWISTRDNSVCSLTWTNPDFTDSSYWLIQIVDLNGLVERPEFMQVIGTVVARAIGGTLTLDVYLVETNMPVTLQLYIENYRDQDITLYVILNFGFKTESTGQFTLGAGGNKTFTKTFNAPSAPQDIMRTFQVTADVYDSEGVLWLALETSYDVLNQAPTVQLLEPESGAIINGTVTFDFKVEDVGVGVASFSYRWSHQASWTAVEEPYDFEWDTREVDDGRITLYARAYDENGLLAEKQYYFYVRNGEVTVGWGMALRNLIEQVSKIAFVPTIILAFIIFLIGFVTAYAWKRKPKKPEVIAVPIVLDKEALEKLKGGKK